MPDSPARRAGILGSEEPAPPGLARLGVSWTGHIITAVDGHPTPTLEALRTYLSTCVPGQTVRLTVTIPGVATADREVTLGTPAP
jgi:S1-C subfamily serine protease